MKFLIFRKFVMALTLLISCSGLGWAQQTTGGIEGVVKDSTGGVLPGVSITITDQGTGRTLEAITNDSGLFRVRSIPASTYEVQASLTGFKTQIRIVTVPVGETVPSNFQLEVGAISEIITVEAQTIQVNEISNTVAGTVTATEVRKLPLNGRNFLDLAQTEPGVQLVDGGS